MTKLGDGQPGPVTPLTEVADEAGPSPLNDSAKHRGAIAQVHPLGWAAFGLIVVALGFHMKGSDWLIGNFSWWHWVGLAGTLAISLRPTPIKKLSEALDTISEYMVEGAGRFAHPWSAFATSVIALCLVGLAIGPLTPAIDAILGTKVESVGPDFVISSSSRGWISAPLAALALVAGLVLLSRLLAKLLPGGPISVFGGTICGAAAFAITFVAVTIASDWQTGLTSGLAVSIAVASMALGPLWVVSWGIFVVIFVYVVSRYSARYVEANIIVGEVNSLGLQMFALLALLGVGHGVKTSVNPRIDFWWAEFSNKAKAWITRDDPKASDNQHP